MKHCKWCDSEFNTEVSYQIYCSVKCREQATKEKIAERYLVLRRQKRIGKERKCIMAVVYSIGPHTGPKVAVFRA